MAKLCSWAVKSKQKEVARARKLAAESKRNILTNIVCNDHDQIVE
jgi:hypothetical protein